MDFWTSLLALILTPVAVTGAVAYMTRGLFEQLLKRDVERYRHELHQAGELQKKLLETVQFEHHTKFSWAHEKQAQVISDVYGKLAVAHKAMLHMTSPVQFGHVDREAQRKAAADAYQALEDSFLLNRVFLSEKRAEEVESVVTMMRTSFNQFGFAQTPGSELKQWMEVWNRIEKEMPPLLAGLRREFRATLGIPE